MEAASGNALDILTESGGGFGRPLRLISDVDVAETPAPTDVGGGDSSSWMIALAVAVSVVAVLFLCVCGYARRRRKANAAAKALALQKSSSVAGEAAPAAGGTAVSAKECSAKISATEDCAIYFPSGAVARSSPGGDEEKGPDVELYDSDFDNSPAGIPPLVYTATAPLSATARSLVSLPVKSPASFDGGVKVVDSIPGGGSEWKGVRRESCGVEGHALESACVAAEAGATSGTGFGASTSNHVHGLHASGPIWTRPELGATSPSLPSAEHSEQLQKTDSERPIPVGPYRLQFPIKDEPGDAEGPGESPSDDGHDNNIPAVDVDSPENRTNSPAAAPAAAAAAASVAVAAPYASGESNVGTPKNKEEVTSQRPNGQSDFSANITEIDTERVADDKQHAPTPACWKNRDDDDDRDTVGSVRTVGLEESGTEVELGDAGMSPVAQEEIAEATVVVDGIGNGGGASSVHSVKLASGGLSEREKDEMACHELVMYPSGWGVTERPAGDGNDCCDSSKHASESRDGSRNHDQDDNHSENPVSRDHDDDETIRIMAEDTDADESFRGEDIEKMSLASPSMPGLVAMPRSFSAIGSSTSPTDNSHSFSVPGFDGPDGSLYTPSPIALLHSYRCGWDVNSTESPCPPYRDVTGSARNNVKRVGELIVDESMPPPRVPLQRPPRPPPLPPRPVVVAPSVGQTCSSGDRVVGSDDSDAGSVIAVDDGIVRVDDADAAGEEVRGTGDDRVDPSTNHDHQKEPWPSAEAAVLWADQWKESE